jgi:hypothetical protein
MPGPTNSNGICADRVFAMELSLLAACSIGVGRDCSMGLGRARYTAQQRLQLAEGGQRHVRNLGETHAATSLALGHPVRDDDEASLGRDADEGPVAGRGPMRPRDRQGLAV